MVPLSQLAHGATWVTYEVISVSFSQKVAPFVGIINQKAQFKCITDCWKWLNCSSSYHISIHTAGHCQSAQSTGTAVTYISMQYDVWMTSAWRSSIPNGFSYITWCVTDMLPVESVAPQPILCQCLSQGHSDGNSPLHHELFIFCYLIYSLVWIVFCFLFFQFSSYNAIIHSYCS